MTGVPSEKRAGDRVIGATVNGTGSFVMRTERVGADTVLAQIVRMVAEAQRSRAPIQRLADMVAGYFVPMVMGGLEGVATMHHCHTPEIALTSATTATGIWAMEDLLVFADGGEMHGAGHYHETYEKQDGSWRIKTLHLTRTILKISNGG